MIEPRHLRAKTGECRRNRRAQGTERAGDCKHLSGKIDLDAAHIVSSWVAQNYRGSRFKPRDKNAQNECAKLQHAKALGASSRSLKAASGDEIRPAMHRSIS